jgi:methionyl-tRNA synthetase
MCALDFAAGIGAVRRFIDAVNLYVTEQEPWVVAKDDALASRLDTILYTVCESLRAIATLYNPVMPKAMGLLWEQIGAAATLGPIGEQPIARVAEWGQLPAGAAVTKGAVLFPRLEEEPA